MIMFLVHHVNILMYFLLFYINAENLIWRRIINKKPTHQILGKHHHFIRNQKTNNQLQRGKDHYSSTQIPIAPGISITLKLLM